MRIKIHVFVTAIAVLRLAATAADVAWSGGGADSEWLNAANWSSNPNLPVEGTGTAGDVVLLDATVNYPVFDAGDGTRTYQAVRVGYNADGRLDLTGGTLVHSHTTQQRIGRAAHTGTVNISGTGKLQTGHIAEIGIDNGSIGVVNISENGTYQVTRGATKDGVANVSIALGAGGTGQGTLTIGDKGRVYTRFGVLLGQTSLAGAGLYHVNGGTSVSLLGGNNGGNPGDNGFWLQRANGTLKATVDAGGALGTITIYDAGASYVRFDAGAKLDLGFGGAPPPVTTSWDLMTFYDGVLTNSGLTLDAADAADGWSFAFVDARGGPGVDTLRITYTVSNSIVPTGLVATPGPALVELNWNSISNALSYQVKRGVTSGGPYPVTNNVATNAFTDFSVSNGVTYFYVVSTVTAGGLSADSSEVSVTPTRFIHPGGLFKQSDMDRMRFMVQAGMEPWLTSFNTLKANSKASYLYAVQGDPTWTDVSRDPPSTHKGQYESDVTAAYLNALMWIVTQDTRHADKCVQIFNTWKNLKNVQGGGTEALNGGLYAWKFVEAAEIIQSTYSGWSLADRQEFKDMLVHPGYSSVAVPASVNNTNGTFYWRIYKGDPGRHGNQDLIAWRAMIVMGVFLDNEKMYDRALRYFKGMPGRLDDIVMPTGPSPSGSQTSSNEYFIAYQYLGSQGTIPNYGYNGVLTHYVWESGQNQESSRDQQHAFFGLGICAGIAEVAWNQGDAVWNSSSNRLRLGFEFMSKYNTSFLQSFPDQPTPWEPDNFIQRKDRTGRWFSQKINPHFESDFVTVSRGEFAANRPVYEQAVAHFDVRMGQASQALWSIRGREVAIVNAGYETTGWSLDHPGWGALTFRRPPLAAGDPISGFRHGQPVFAVHQLPGIIEAENYDSFPTDGEGRTYHDLTATNSGGVYRSNAVDIAFDTVVGHHLTDLEASEWTSYTVNVPANGNYGIAIRYAADGAGSTVAFACGTNEVTTTLTLPPTGNEWTNLTVTNRIPLLAGVQVLRLMIGSASTSARLDRITILPALDYSREGNELHLSWPTNQTGWRLEAQTNAPAFGMGGSWFPVPGAELTNQLTVPINLAHGSCFFRLTGP